MSSLQIIKQGHDEYAGKGKKAYWCIWSPLIPSSVLKLAYLVFSAAKQLCTNLQAKEMTVSEGTRGALLLRSRYASLQSEAAFAAFTIMFWNPQVVWQMNQSYPTTTGYREKLMKEPCRSQRQISWSLLWGYWPRQWGNREAIWSVWSCHCPWGGVTAGWCCQ